MNNGILKSIALFSVVCGVCTTVPINAEMKANNVGSSYLEIKGSTHNRNYPQRADPELLLGNIPTIHHYRRIDNAPYSANAGKRNSSNLPALNVKTNVVFQAEIPGNLGIRNSDVKWSVRPVSGRGLTNKMGRQATIPLTAGRYTVNLQIGHFNETRQINVRKSRNMMQTEVIPVRMGLLKASSHMGSGMEDNVIWKVRDSRGRVIATTRGRALQQMVPAGVYKVEAIFNNEPRGRNVTVANGRISEEKFKISAGTIRLKAVDKFNQPLMQRNTQMVVTDSSGKLVSQTSRSTNKLDLIPGNYRVEVRAGQRVSSTQFTVRPGVNADVVIKTSM